MVNFPQIGTAAAAALAPFMLTANAGALPREFQPSLGYPPDQPTLPTKPTPGRAEIAGLSRRGDWDFIDQRPVEVAQVANRPSNSPLVPPPDYGRDGAREINNLQGQIESTDRELTQGLRVHNRAQNERLQQLLKRTNK